MTQSSFPLQEQPQFANQLGQLFADIFARVAYSRSLKRQRNVTCYIGQENVGTQKAPPSIVIVPRGCDYTSARKWPDSVDPKPYYSQWLILDCECWGDDDPSSQISQYAFDSSLELTRQLLIAMADANYGPASVVPVSGDFEQSVNVNRLGRKYILRVKLETFITRDQPIQVQPEAAVSVNIQNNESADAVIFMIPGGGTDPNGPQ